MITPIHVGFDLGIYFLLDYSSLVEINNIDIYFLLSAQLIDLDHLFSKPIYHPRRNGFKTHFLHKKWKYLSIISIIFLFYRPLLFLWIGLLSHLFLDFLYLKIYKIKK